MESAQKIFSSLFKAADKTPTETTYANFVSFLKAEEREPLEMELASLIDIPGMVSLIQTALATGNDQDLPLRFFSHITKAFQEGKVPFSAFAVASQIFNLQRDHVLYEIHPLLGEDRKLSATGEEFFAGPDEAMIPFLRGSSRLFAEKIAMLSPAECFVRKYPINCSDGILDSMYRRLRATYCCNRARTHILHVSPTICNLFYSLKTPHPQRAVFYAGPCSVGKMRELMAEKMRPVALSYPTAPRNIEIHDEMVSWNTVELHDTGYHLPIVSFIPKRVTDICVSLEAALQAENPTSRGLKKAGWMCLDIGFNPFANARHIPAEALDQKAITAFIIMPIVCAAISHNPPHEEREKLSRVLTETLTAHKDVAKFLIHDLKEHSLPTTTTQQGEMFLLSLAESIIAPRAAASGSGAAEGWWSGWKEWWPPHKIDRSLH